MNNFYRSNKNKYVSGVCGGLQNLTGINGFFWRVLMISFLPSTLIPYLILTLITEKKD